MVENPYETRSQLLLCGQQVDYAQQGRLCLQWRTVIILSAGCCDALNHSRCTGVDWSCCLMQQGFLPNFFSMHESENMKQRRRLLKGNLPATPLSDTQRILPLVLCSWLSPDNLG